MMDFLKGRRAQYLVFLLAFGLLLTIVFLLGRLSAGRPKETLNPVTEKKVAPANQELRLIGKYKFISPLLACSAPTGKGFDEYKILEQKVLSLINTKIANHEMSIASIYFRDFTNGRWAGVNETERYSPASLLKVPLMIAYLRQEESQPGLLAKKMLYDGSFDDNQKEFIKPLKSLEPGKLYTTEELIRFMIAYSDNNASKILAQNIDSRLLKEVYTDLGITIPDAKDHEIDFMTVKSYGYFFRVLFNGSYLTREMSEKALGFLNEPDFPQGISAGIPADIEVAQKFGERSIESERGDIGARELHDCGIVYAPLHPYLLCVMTKGDDFTKLTNVIKDISALVFHHSD